jgi:HK97 family phage portal protein
VGLFTRIRTQAEAPRQRPPDDADVWYDGTLDGRFSVSTSGVRMSADAALRLSAVWAAVRILVEGIAALPCIVYKQLDNGGKERAKTHPLYTLLKRYPNSWQTAIEFWEMMMGHVVLRGNAYAQIIPGARGAVDQLLPRHPDRMKVESIETPRGLRLRYTWTPPGQPPVVLTQDEVFHIRGLTSDGITGLILADHAIDSFGLSKAASDYGASFFRKGATVAGIVEHPKELKGNAAVNLKQSIESQMANPHGIMVLEEGMKWQNIGFNVQDTQLIETMEFGIEEVARWFNVPVHLLRSNKQAQTYASVEAFDIELVIHTLRPWAVRIEQAISRDLIVADDTYFAEFLMDALMRGDSTARKDFYASAITNGWMTRNEARIKENLNPLDGLDEPLVPLNMGTGNPPPAGQEQVTQQPPSKQQRGASLARAAVDRVLRREAGAVSKAQQKYAKEPKAYQAWAEAFYAEHATFVAEALALPTLVAAAYCAERLAKSYPWTEHTQVHRDALVTLALQEYDDACTENADAA